jgi:hypothetical protein
MKPSSSTPDRKATAAIYREAAALIARGGNAVDGWEDAADGARFHGACDVLHCPSLSFSFQRVDLRGQFYETFVHGEHYTLISDVVVPESEAQKVRVLALCFMAAITERP